VLSNTTVTDAGLGHLAGWRQLRALNLSSTAVTDAGLRDLGQLPNLEVLVLNNTQVTDQGVAELKRLAQLRRLWILNTAVSDGAIGTCCGPCQVRDPQARQPAARPVVRLAIDSPVVGHDLAVVAGRQRPQRLRWQCCR